MPLLTLRRAIVLVLAIGALGVTTLFGVIEPHTDVGYAVFRVGYALSPDSDAYLRRYAAGLREFNGSYVPPDIGAFLARRWAHGSPDEQQTVIAFHVRQGWGRTGSGFENLGADGIAPLLRYLETPPAFDDHRLCLGMLEGIRRGDAFGKGGYGGDLSHAEVEERFRDWWERDLPWEQKSAIDPLADAGDCWGEL